MPHRNPLHPALRLARAAAVTVSLVACEPAGEVAVEGPRARDLDVDVAVDVAAADIAPPAADAGPARPDAAAPSSDARPGATDAGVAEILDGAALTADVGAPPSEAGPATTDAAVVSSEVGPSDALPPPADAFVHVLPEAGRADAALSISDRLAACDGDPLLSGRLEVDESGWGHVPIGTEVAYAHNPPASGPHYGQWARSAIYPEALDRRTWVHNLEHGWLVLLYHPDAPAAAVQVLLDAYAGGFPDAECPAGPVRRIIVTPDPLLPTPVAAVTAFRVLAGERLAPADVERMFALCRVAAPEGRVCADGQVPAPPSAAPSAP